ncbi:MAG TPA: prepilin-type N-terminal cleavage/methylation domain-containing protein [Vicinamibacterales bacterium]|nr:prepilin-type N-terminal cleavage/methylation domain-containing protein [Vicinamibacterales bacterium]
MQERGFTLIEVLSALALLCVASLGVGRLIAAATEGMAAARAQTIAVSLAAARLEQLRALPYSFDADGLRVTDTTANLSTEPVSRGGSGLVGAGGDSLAANTAGFVDYLDAHGRWVGTGPAPAQGAVFVRRWSIDAVASWPDVLVVQVVVRRVAEDAAAADPRRRTRTEARLVSMLVRVAR